MTWWQPTRPLTDEEEAASGPFPREDKNNA